MKGYTYSKRRPAPDPIGAINRELRARDEAFISNSRSPDTEYGRAKLRYHMHLIDNDPRYRMERKVQRAQTAQEQRRAVTAIPTKVCNRCGKEKPLSAFRRHASARDGHRKACMTCSP